MDKKEAIYLHFLNVIDDETCEGLSISSSSVSTKIIFRPEPIKKSDLIDIIEDFIDTINLVKRTSYTINDCEFYKVETYRRYPSSSAIDINNFKMTD